MGAENKLVPVMEIRVKIGAKRTRREERTRWVRSKSQSAGGLRFLSNFEPLQTHLRILLNTSAHTLAHNKFNSRAGLWECARLSTPFSFRAQKIFCDLNILFRVSVSDFYVKKVLILGIVQKLIFVLKRYNVLFDTLKINI